jgi:hypothetical protein
VHFALCWIEAENNFTGGRLGRRMLWQGAEHHEHYGRRYEETEKRFQEAAGRFHLLFF